MSRLLTAIFLVVLTGLLARASQTPSASVVDLSQLPYRFGDWRGFDAGPLDETTVKELGADAYLNRTYLSGATPVGLYVGFYVNQRPGASMHSPLNCLPGTGWEPIDVRTVPVGLTAPGSGRVRELLVQKSGDRALVLFWYQVHGRMVANEVASKGYLLVDSLRFGRRDAALVRIVVPMADSLDAARQQGMRFVLDLVPSFTRLWS